jgi:hypothetical protein
MRANHIIVIFDVELLAVARLIWKKKISYCYYYYNCSIIIYHYKYVATNSQESSVENAVVKYEILMNLGMLSTVLHV